MKKTCRFIYLAVFLPVLLLMMMVSGAWATTYRGKVQTTDATFGSGDSFYNKNISLFPYSPAIPTALTITGGTTILNGSNVQGWRGIFVDPSGTYAMVELYGASVSTLVNIIPGSYWAAVALEGTGAEAEIYNSTITGNGVGTHGLLAANSGHAWITDSSVTANGINSNGLYAYGGDYYIAMSRGSVTVNGAAGSAVKAEGAGGSGIILTNTTVTANGAGTNGLYANDGGYITMSGGSVSTAGAASHAVISSGSDSEVDIEDADVSTSGLGSYGLYANSGGSIFMEDGTVSTSGLLGSHAVISSGSGSEVSLNDVHVSTNGIWNSAVGLYAYGIYAADGGEVDMDGGSVSTTGALSHGAVAEGDGSLISMSSAGDVSTEGIGAYGLYANSGGRIYMNGDPALPEAFSLSFQSVTTISTTGDYAHAVMSSGTGSEIYLSGVSLSTEGDSAYGLYADDGGFIEMEGGSIDSLSDTYMYVDNGYLDLYGATAGRDDAESLLLTDSSGTVNAYEGTVLTGNVRHTGGSDGTLDLTLASGSSLAGMVNANTDNPDAKINVTLFDNSAAWYVRGDSTTNGKLANAGTVDYIFSNTVDADTMSFVVPDGDYSGYKTITAADFEGLSDSLSSIPGTLKMKADISGNMSDLLYVTGAASGTNMIDVQNISNSGAERMDAMIVVDNGADSTAEFSLVDPDGVVDAGAWNYVLAEEMNGNSKEWYLKRNSLTSVGQGIVSSVVDSEIWYTEVGTLFDRLKIYKNGYVGGVWANAVAKKVEFDGGFGSVFDEEFRTVSLGYDKKLDRDNGVLYQGVMLGYGNAD